METKKVMKKLNLQPMLERTHVVIVAKEEKAEDNRKIKKAIENELAPVYRKVLVVREDKLNDKNLLRGYTVTSVEFRTMIKPELYQKVVGSLAVSMTFGKDSLKKQYLEKS